MKLRIEIPEGGMIPWTHAPAWDEFYPPPAMVICYPLGLHLIIRYAYRAWMYVRFFRIEDRVCPQCVRLYMELLQITNRQTEEIKSLKDCIDRTSKVLSYWKERAEMFGRYHQGD